MTTAFLHGLRMLGDLLIYGTFAAFFTACLGGGPAPLLLLLPAFCYGVSACFSQRRILRTGCAVLSLLGLLLVPDRVDQAAYLPAVFYAVYLAWKGDYLLSASRQSDVFFLFCKVYPVFAVALSLIWDADVMLTVSLPLAVWAAFLQIFLVRVLRQAPAVYQKPSYLLRSAGSLAALAALGFLLSRPTVLGGAQAVVKAVYFGLVVPVLTLPLALLAWLAEHALLPAMTALLRWIAARSGNLDPDLLESPPGQSSAGQSLPTAGEPLMDGERLLDILGLILLAAGCAWLFRRLLQANKAKQFSLTKTGQTQTRKLPRRAHRRPAFFLSPNARIRRAYGRYLERQVQHGVLRTPSETSLDRLGRTPFLDQEAERQLRRLYLKARYGECATPQDAAAAERLEKALEQPK
ncbi:MAG TPA: DUF4129 domain-containing protein [Candidatus Faecalibacterium gallistercoris]|uniref:DUF4129 domain-containing protein n=1 Tax=Candidatus Faecalibacterium gallistercoris TaxID=2838579 RepID=A0A9D2FF66_9FIRM|nr:DUF4129 domain-containing protein [Candidatus Faecalibacterium gallistercoris]